MTKSVQTPVQEHVTAIITGALAKLKSVSNIHHHLLAGELRESFITNLLKPYLPELHGIGSAIVVNPAGGQSSQWDINIYDKNILPALVFEMSRGIFPAEAVLAVIEVKSRLPYHY
jgi:hypothetical protein